MPFFPAVIRAQAYCVLATIAFLWVSARAGRIKGHLCFQIYVTICVPNTQSQESK